MTHTYVVTGMTCNGCVASVEDKLSNIKGVGEVVVDLEKGEAKITMEHHIPLETLQAALPEKYNITEKQPSPSKNQASPVSLSTHAPSKFQQLKPLFLIFIYLFAAAYLLNYKDGTIYSAMLDFMGLFYIVFSFFKLLDLKGFPESFRMYDPLAKVFPMYGWIYPFIEIALGLMFLMRWNILAALIITIIILGITTVGVTKTLLDKKSIRCACLGTALNLPMTEATFIENAIMLIMAITMLTQYI